MPRLSTDLYAGKTVIMGAVPVVFGPDGISVDEVDEAVAERARQIKHYAVVGEGETLTPVAAPEPEPVVEPDPEPVAPAGDDLDDMKRPALMRAAADAGLRDYATMGNDDLRAAIRSAREA